MTTTEADNRASVFATRFDAITRRIDNVAKILNAGTTRDELADCAAELKRMRRDLSGLASADLAAIDPPSPHGGTGQQRQRLTAAVGTVTRPNREGQRFCGKHNEGKGAYLPLINFAVKDKRTGARKSWCRDCTVAYMATRYVRVGAKVLTVEVTEADACVGKLCPACTNPFVIGDHVQGENVQHEACRNASL